MVRFTTNKLVLTLSIFFEHEWTHQCKHARRFALPLKMLGKLHELREKVFRPENLLLKNSRVRESDHVEFNFSHSNYTASTDVMKKYVFLLAEFHFRYDFDKLVGFL